MIQTNLQIAFSLEVFHSYFEKNICKCLQFRPGPVTKKLQKRFDCKLRHNINGFEFYINTKQSVPALLNYITKTTNDTYFDFEMESNNPWFIYFTELPLNWAGQLVYDTQAAANTNTDGLLNLDQNLSANTGRTLGIVSVQFEDIARHEKDHAKLNISFEARATQWQYYFINKSALSLDNPAISKTEISFTGPEPVLLETGEQALLFSSGNNLLSLSEVPKYKFDLVNYTSAGKAETEKKSPASKIVFKALPNPSPRQMGMTEINGKRRISSPMYVYL